MRTLAYKQHSLHSVTDDNTKVYFVIRVSYHYNTCRALLRRQNVLILLSNETSEHIVNHIHAPAWLNGNHMAQLVAISSRYCPKATELKPHM